MQHRIINTDIIEYTEEKTIENTLRPSTLESYIGQDDIKKILVFSIAAAKNRKEPLDHILLYGPPGLGKTTLANIIANEMGVSIRTISGPAIEKPGELAGILSSLKENSILFIDEIHRLNRPVEEVLYSAMEDYAIDITIGKGPETKGIRLDLPKFTLIGATTRIGMLTAPLRDRFGLVQKMEYYTDEQLIDIVKRSAKVLETNIEENSAREIAIRGRGTPRLVNRLLKRVRDYSDVHHNGFVTEDVTKEVLNFLKIDKYGFDISDRRFLEIIETSFNGGPVGLNTLASALSEDAGAIEDVIEPYMISKGFLMKTPRGRVLTDKAKEYVRSVTYKQKTL